MNQLESTCAVAFDMDGLIFNTEDLYDEATETVLNRRGKSFSNEVKLAMMGRPGPVAIDILREAYALTESPEEIFEETKILMHGLMESKLDLMPGFLKLLDQIKAKGWQTAVATSSTRSFTDIALGKFELHEEFHFILTAEDVTNGKPHPEIYQTAAVRFGVETNRMFVFEDSVTGSRAAAEAGATTIAVPTRHGKGLDYSHAKLVANTLNDPKIAELLGL